MGVCLYKVLRLEELKCLLVPKYLANGTNIDLIS